MNDSAAVERPKSQASLRERDASAHIFSRALCAVIRSR